MNQEPTRKYRSAADVFVTHIPGYTPPSGSDENRDDLAIPETDSEKKVVDNLLKPLKEKLEQLRLRD